MIFYYWYLKKYSLTIVLVYIRALNHGTNEVTLANPVGHPDSQPRPLTNEAIPISTLSPCLWIVSGPPESPLHAPTLPPLLPVPEVQTLNFRTCLNYVRYITDTNSWLTGTWLNDSGEPDATCCFCDNIELNKSQVLRGHISWWKTSPPRCNN